VTVFPEPFLFFLIVGSLLLTLASVVTLLVLLLRDSLRKRLW
jgi:hypothetical protein